MSKSHVISETFLSDMRQTSYGLSKGLDALGVKGGEVPGLQSGGMVPVIQVGNLGNNFAAQVFESRGLVALLVAVLAADEIPTLSIQAVGRGGIVIERIRLLVAQLGGGRQFRPAFRLTRTPRGDSTGEAPKSIRGCIPRPVSRSAAPSRSRSFAWGPARQQSGLTMRSTMAETSLQRIWTSGYRQDSSSTWGS